MFSIWFLEYNEIVARSLRSYDEQCPIDVKAAFDSVKELLAADGGAEKLKTYFKYVHTLILENQKN